MNAAQLQAYANAHKPVVLGVAAAGVAGLALLKKKKTATGATGATGSSARPAGTIPAAAVVPSQQTGSTYDSSAFDVYNALSGQLEQLRQTTGGAISTAPDPGASPLINTNTDWMKTAVTGWVQQNGGNAIDEQSVLNAYLKGAPITKSDLYGINWAVNKYGAPPEGTPGVSPLSG